MLRNAKVYLSYFAQALKSRLAYKGDFLALAFSSLLITLTGIIFITALIDGDKVPSISGWRNIMGSRMSLARNFVACRWTILREAAC